MAAAETTLIRQARAYDPSQQWRGELRDLYLAGGRISDPFENPERTIHAEGRPLLAGGIDPYCHLAGQGHAFTRMLAGVPCPEEIGRAYARMGYVHVHHPFTTLLTAGLTRHALGRIPFVDTSTCVSIDLRDMGPCMRAGQPAEFARLARALVRLTGAMGLSLPFPSLRHKERHYIQKNLTAKKVLLFLSLLEDPELLPIHLWGMPGLFDNEFLKADRFHVAGLGFALDSEASLEQAGNFLQAGGSADLGLNTGQAQLFVTPHTTLEASGLSLDTGMHTPLAYSCKPLPLDHPRALAGWLLLKQMPASCRLALGASGPAGGQFGGMPAIVTWLLNPDSRPPALQEALLGYPFDLYEWARMTRLEPARSIGLPDVGHLRVGARASLALYDPLSEKGKEETASALTDCWCLLKDGVLVRDRGTFTGQQPPVETRCRDIDADLSGLTKKDLFQNATLRFEHLGAYPGQQTSGR